MDKKEFIAICDSKLKLIRAEYGFSQDKMAIMIGASKKTLVGIEKGRSSLGWTGSVALCAVFSGSEVLNSAFGGQPAEFIRTIAFGGNERPDAENRNETAGGLWWQTIKSNAEYTIQQNIISQHYRLVSADGERIASSFEIGDLMEVFDKQNK